MSDSSDSSDGGDELLFPSTDPAAEEFDEPRRKRRKTTRDARESAALGVFGSDSEDDGPKVRWKSKTLRGKSMGFVKSNATPDNEQQNSPEDDEDEDEEMGGVGFEDTAGLRGMASRGLGWDTPKNNKEDEEDNGTPLGRGFVPSSSRQPAISFAPPAGDSPTPAKNLPSYASSSSSRAKGGGVNPKSFAAKMMAKMGYQEGQGLGASGQGMLNPIEAQLRPQGVGLGAVREKTQQAKDEAKRRAALEGRVYEDSSEEERKKRKKKKEKHHLGTGSGTSTPTAKPKTKYRTVAELDVAASGLEIPNVLKSLIDATGKETRLLTSTSGLMTPTEGPESQETETWKMAKRARRDLEAFVDDWNGLADRKTYIAAQEDLVTKDIDEHVEQIRQLDGLISSGQDLAVSEEAEDVPSRWEELTTKLVTLEVEYGKEIEEFALSELAIAAIHPLFRLDMESWDPLQSPTHLTPYLHRLSKLLGIIPHNDLQNGYHKSTTLYETMIYTLWLPPVRSAILNDWDVYKPSAAVTLIESWRDLLPGFVYANVIDQLILLKLSVAVNDWKPRGKRKSHTPAPHIWLFPWLQFLDDHHMDPRSATGLLSDVKRKFKIVLDAWDVSRGVVDGLRLWKEVLKGELDVILVRYLLPRLAAHLRENFTVDPQDQDMASLADVLKWKDFFKPTVVAQLLLREFFPKWLDILHIWLTSEEPNWDEIAQWYQWWKEQIPSEVNELQIIEDAWNRGLEMMNQAMEGLPLPDVALPIPKSGPSTPVPSVETPRAVPSPPIILETTFKDAVEEWCAEEGLIMLPLREAHTATGLPLFRITANALGKGGVLAYLKGDVLWAQNKKAKEVWEPVMLDESLVARAEGR